ncbi:hypothetical protein MHB40_03100 [Lysinibacillus sp. FSL K6-0057]|uniref:hypothetical protein n=1 Tax=Lysinibacillus sp. FSL K6-0057 TaxID=2921411 RepID=UPI00315B1418
MLDEKYVKVTINGVGYYMALYPKDDTVETVMEETLFHEALHQAALEKVVVEEYDIQLEKVNSIIHRLESVDDREYMKK